MSKRKHNQSNLTGALDLLPQSFRLVKDNLNIFIAIYSVSALFAIWDFLNQFTNYKEIWSTEQFTPSKLFGSASGLDVSTPGGVFGGLAVFLGVVSIAFGLMQIILTLRVSQHRRPNIHDIWREFIAKGLKLLILVLALGLIIVLGLIALIVPGVILIWRLFLAPYILLDQNTGIKESIKRSWHMTSGYAWPIYSIILLTIVLGVTGAVPVFGPIMAFLLATAYANAPALRYQEIKNRPRHSTSSK